MRVALFLFFGFLATAFAFPEEENENPDLFESDMLLTPLQRIYAETQGDVALASMGIGRASAKNKGRLWLPEKLVPYTMTEDISSSPTAVWGITQGIRDWETKTCLQFIKRSDEKDYIEFIEAKGCWSYVGRVGGKQNVSIGTGCHGVGTVVHEIGHAMGFWHEQSRPDRDQFIGVVWENVPEKKRHNFKYYNNSIVDSLGTPYDYLSVMQYSKTAFGGSNVTMQPLRPGVFQLGQRVGLSGIDSYQARQLYGCQGATTRPHHKPRHYEIKGNDGCTFDHGFCHFTNDHNDDFDWTRRVGGTPSRHTGPTHDHTTGAMGAFAFIEATNPRVQNDTARLLSRVFEPTRVTCVTFFYHMYANRTEHMGTLNVYLKEFGLPQPRLLFTKSGDQGRGWNYGKFQFYSRRIHQIIFEGIRGDGYQGDLAIDDVSFQQSRCPVKIPKEKMPCVDDDCEDTTDREGEYCQMWHEAGICASQEKLMRKYCPKTCGFCKSDESSSY